MYNLPYYKANNRQEVFDFMKHHPFVLLVAKGEEFPVATQVPVLFEEREGKMFLRAHIMRKTDHHKALEQNANVLVVFNGAHSYVSASWYTDKLVGSTWNYKAVHAQGKLNFTDNDDLVDLLTQLTSKYEKQDSPSLVKNLSAEYMNSMIKAIVGIEIEITSIAHVFKMSQNRDLYDRQNIIANLENGDSDAKAIAEIMKVNC